VRDHARGQFGPLISDSSLIHRHRFPSHLALGVALALLAFGLGSARNEEARGAAGAALAPAHSANPVPPPTSDCSPLHLALSADGHFALTANRDSDSASLVDLSAGKVAAEVRCGRRPADVALSADGRRGVVTNQFGSSVTLLAVHDRQLEALAEIPVGPEPRGVALSRDGRIAYVALSAGDALAVVDLERRRVQNRVPVGREPWSVALSPDQRWLVVGNTRSQDVSLIDTHSNQVARTVRLAGDNLRGVTVSPDGHWAYIAHLFERGFPTTEENIGHGWVTASRVSRVLLDEDAPKEALALDPQGHAVGDPEGIAVSPDGRWLAIAGSGTHELLLLRAGDAPFVAFGGPGDFIEPELLTSSERFRRVPVGGRPVGVAFSPDSRTVYAANVLDNSLQTVDVAAAKLTRSVSLGGPTAPSPARRGEAIFTDATRSHNQWFSCNTCHADGHTNGTTFDTLNDGRYGNPKKVPSLRGVAETGPWTWHGWQTNLEAAAIKSLTDTMHGPPVQPGDAAALVAYMRSIPFPPNPYRLPDGRLTPAAQRGKKVFESEKAGCAHCHPAPLFTDGGIHDVGLGEPDDVYKGYNPPSLRNVYARAPYLHDGRAATLMDVLTGDHRPEKVTGRGKLAGVELADLIEYVKSL
jgi:DNA-binding beta-propeller fold protein YncE